MEGMLVYRTRLGTINASTVNAIAGVKETAFSETNAVP
jgi:hypothetical protein